MKSGQWLLKSIVLSSCMGLLAACSTVPKNEEATTSVASADNTAAVEEETEVEVAEEPAEAGNKVYQAQPLRQATPKRNNTQVSRRISRPATARALPAQPQRRVVAQAPAVQRPVSVQRPAPAPQRRSVRPFNQAQSGGNPVNVTYGGRGTGSYYATSLTGDFAGDPRLIYFIEAMSKRYGFDRNYLYGVFSQVRNRDEVARLWAGNSGGAATPGGWYNYRAKFVTPENIQRGAQFWRQYGPHLQRAYQQYGVDPAYIVGIMGVETRWGRILGKHRIIDALTTSALVNERRSDFFFNELENFMLMTRTERMDPLEPKGSYAGAMGYGQFMPTSFHSYAVDFDGDGIKDLWNPVDAIGSIANYFAKHGWRSGQEVAVPATVSTDNYANMPDGFKVTYNPGTLAQNGIMPQNGRWANTGRTHLLALTTVPDGPKEPWIGYQNFYVITRYNHSNYYAMAVHQLGQGVQAAVGGQKYASR